MYRHIRNSCKIAPNPKNGDAGMERLYEHTLQKQIADQSAKIAKLNSDMKEIMQLLRQQQGSTSSSSTFSDSATK